MKSSASWRCIRRDSTFRSTASRACSSGWAIRIVRLPPVIHIAGTNGKGSAAAFSRALLEAAGYLVHVHTSPHLVNWHERYRLAA